MREIRELTGMTAAAVIAVAGLLGGCTSTGGGVEAVSEQLRPRVALVLGGGAARGFAHIGVIRVFEQEKIPIDLIVGTSVGSLIGGLYAAEGNSFELEWIASTLTKDDLFDYSIIGATMGPVKGERLEAFVKKSAKAATIEEMKIPFAAVAADLNRGTRVVLDRGSLARAIRASCAIPGVFQPVEHQGRLLVDGGTVDNLPIAVARQKGADIVVAVDISQNVTNYNISNLVDVTLQAVNIMFSENVAFRRRDADVLVTPAVGDMGMMDFSQKKRAIQAGIDAARKVVPAVRQAMESWQAKGGRSGMRERLTVPATGS